MSLNETKPKKKNIVGRILFWIAACIIAILLAVILLVTVMIRPAAEPPLLFGYSFIPLTTGGTFPKGDLIICKALALDEVSEDTKIDVIYRKTIEGHPSVLTLGHCIGTEKTDGVFYFKLDKGDEKIPQTELIGAVSITVPHFGGFVMFIKTPLGLIFCIAIPLLLLLVLEVVNLVKLSKSPQDEEDEEASEEDKLPSYMRLDNINEMKNAESGKDKPDFSRPPMSLDETNITDEIVSNLKSNPLFEEVNEKLEIVSPRGPFQTLSYKKPPVSETEAHKPSIYSTKEWELPIVEKKNPIAPTAVQMPVVQEAVIVPPKAKLENDFMANIGGDSKNHFNIEGIDVKVLSNAVKLSLDEGQQNRDISITVTNEYTNVVVESEDYEVNFALFKDNTDKEQKVIIQKKSKAN